MGAVYTWHQIRNRRLPELSSFEGVLQGLREAVTHEPSIMAAVVCGSVIMGGHNPRSDVDLVVIYDIERKKRAREFLSACKLEAKTLHIPLSIIPVDSRLASTRMHHIGGSFAHHIRIASARGGALKGDLPAMLADGQNMPDEVRSYLRRKLYKLDAGQMEFEAMTAAEQAKYLQKMLESPQHIARKVLCLDGALTVDSKDGVRAAYINRVSSELAQMFTELIEADQRYSQAVERQRAQPEKAAYKRALAELANLISLAVAFAQRNAIMLSA